MAEPADTEDGDAVAGQRFRVAQGVVGGDAGAAHWRGFCIGKLCRYPGQCAAWDNHRLRISARILVTRDLAVLAMNKVAFSALIAVVAAAAEPLDRGAIADRETLDTRTQLGDRSGDFVPGSQRPRHARKAARDKTCVGAADPTCADRQPCFIAACGVVSTSTSSNGAPADFT